MVREGNIMITRELRGWEKGMRLKNVSLTHPIIIFPSSCQLKFSWNKILRFCFHRQRSVPSYFRNTLGTKHGYHQTFKKVSNGTWIHNVINNILHDVLFFLEKFPHIPFFFRFSLFCFGYVGEIFSLCSDA